MQTFTIVSLLAAAVGIMAQGPVSSEGAVGSPSGNTAQACGNGQKLSCCNTGASNIPVLGGNCELPILGQSCAANQAFCCNANQNGLINVGSLCVPVTA